MPNQRSKKKSIVSAYVTKPVKQELKAQAESMGITLTDLAMRIYVDFLKSKGVEVDEKA